MSDPLALKPLVVSMGDPAGIGPELALRAWLARDHVEVPPFAVYAIPEALSEMAWRLGADVPLAVIQHVGETTATFSRRLPVVAVEQRAKAVPGHADPAHADSVIAAIRGAVRAVQAGDAEAVVTLPIAKSVLQSAGFIHPGHTEFLAALAAEADPETICQPVMMLACPELRVVPATIHIPLSAVPAALSSARIETTIRTTIAALSRDFGIATPRVAVAGLNPHAGEDGAFGVEDRDIIAPVVRALADEGLKVTGPHSADTLFHPGARKTYDAVVAMYHDQALIPIKTIAFEDAVNITLGLPFVRTSPDHGTAFDIAGKGIADPTSFLAALHAAASLGLRRRLPAT